MLPKMAFTGFAARYREPKVEEGLEDITRVDFQVCRLFNALENPQSADLSYSSKARKTSFCFGGSSGSRDRPSTERRSLVEHSSDDTVSHY